MAGRSEFLGIGAKVSAAYHEGSHAEIGELKGLGVQYCTIDPKRLLAGQAGVTCCQKDGSAEDRILYLLAGFFAERKAGFSSWPEAFCGAAADFRAAQQLLPLSSVPVDELVARAEALVEAEWPRIQAVAAVLIADEFLTGDQVASILETGTCRYRQPPALPPALEPDFEWQAAAELRALTEAQPKDLVEEAVRRLSPTRTTARPRHDHPPFAG